MGGYLLYWNNFVYISDCINDLKPVPENENIILEPNEQEWVISNNENISQNDLNDPQPNWVIQPDEDNPQPWVIKIPDPNENQLDDDPIFQDGHSHHSSHPGA